MRTLLIAVFIAALVVPASADWDPSQPAKWVQMPDLSETGIDVNASDGFILADDFLCMEQGFITDIHIWGSWLNDLLPYGDDPTAVRFTLSIHEDIPDSVSPTGYSMPGEVLWVEMFEPGTFQVQLWQDGLMEGWLDPPDMFIYPGDSVCWQYNFLIDEEFAFFQEGTEQNPKVYWLDVKAEPLDTQAHFGWKTTLEHWNDDAVWGQGAEPYYGPWYELIYPPDHPFYPESIDLAFVITTQDEPDVIDYGDAPDPPYPTLVASNGAGHIIVPNVFLGTTVDQEIDGQPVPPAFGDDNDGNDDEDGVVFTTPLVPGQVSSYSLTASVGGYLDAWIDFNGNGSFDASDRIATQLPVVAGVNNLTFPVPNSAVSGTITYARFRFSSIAVAGGLTPTGIAADGEVEDYEVFIDEGEPYKWLQEPDLSRTGIDVNATEPFILADDWLCQEPGRIDEIHIWGSWLNDYYPFQEDPGAVDFILSIHADIPASENPDGYSIPGPVLWEWAFPAGSFDVVPWAENITEGWLDPPDGYLFPADWTCWEYVFSVPPDVAFHQVGMPDSNVVYWLDVQAFPHDPAALFGWKTTLDHWNDDAVWGQGAEPYPGPWFELRYPSGQYAGESIDLAFMLRSHYGTGVGEGAFERYGLEQNVPNPFNPVTTVRYQVPNGGGDVTIEVFDVGGRLVTTLVDGFRPAGRHEVSWSGMDADGESVASGVYFCRMTAGEETMSRKMLLLK
jgi:hypothetical protein